MDIRDFEFGPKHFEQLKKNDWAVILTVDLKRYATNAKLHRRRQRFILVGLEILKHCNHEPMDLQKVTAQGEPVAEPDMLKDLHAPNTASSGRRLIVVSR